MCIFFVEFEIETTCRSKRRELLRELTTTHNNRETSDGFKDVGLYPWIIRPKDSRKVAWDLVMMMNILWTICVSPYRIGFNVPASGAMLVLDWVVDVFFYIDVVINFRTGYYQEDMLVLNPRRIANNYFRGWY